MSSRQPVTPLVLAAALALAGCASEPRIPQLAHEAMTAMGGVDAVRGVHSYVMRGGTGTRSRLGQVVRAGEADTPAQLKNVVETLDLQGGRAALDYELAAAGGFTQHRQEVLTKKGERGVGLETVGDRPLAVMSPSGLFSWGSQNSPAMSLRRNLITIVLAAADAQASQPPEDKELDGRTYTFGRIFLNGEPVNIYFDPESKLMAAFETTDTETMLGDVPALYRLEDYRDVNGVKLPHKITIRKGGTPYADLEFTSASINDEAALRVFEIPATADADVERALAGGADYSPVTLTKIGDGVHFAQAYSHHTLVVEFPSFLAIVEAPYTEAQTKTLVGLLSMQFPGKPIRYAAVTHPHYDHTGGMRGIAAQGTTVLATKAHETQLRAILDAPHSNPSDDLASKRKARQPTGSLETFETRKVISEGTRSLELHTITGSPHVDPMVIAYVPGSRILFQSDLFFPGTGGGNTPEASHLLRSVRALNLPVERNAGGHGGVAAFSELVQAVEGKGTN